MPTESPEMPQPTSFRLKPSTIANLDLIAEDMTLKSGYNCSRTDAVSFIAKHVADRVRAERKARKKSEK